MVVRPGMPQKLLCEQAGQRRTTRWVGVGVYIDHSQWDTRGGAGVAASMLAQGPQPTSRYQRSAYHASHALSVWHPPTTNDCGPQAPPGACAALTPLASSLSVQGGVQPHAGAADAPRLVACLMPTLQQTLKGPAHHRCLRQAPAGTTSYAKGSFKCLPACYPQPALPALPCPAGPVVRWLPHLT